MKKSLLIVSFICFLSTAGLIAENLHVDVYQVDVSNSSLQWFAAKFTGKHEGTVKLSAGEINSNHGQLTGFVEIDMNSIVDTDLKDEKMNAKLTNHLKSEDFFNVAKFPKSKFVITSIVPLKAVEEGATHKVSGNLTIKDKTNPLSFNATLIMQSNKLTCVGSAVVDRSKFDVRYGSKTFFEDIGDKVIYDEFTIKFNLVATR
ncbi:MAG: YceI family protein [Bacteroidetes bacterium]|nr:MAG: YceI family protein [Bacteroidota bacterium]